MSNTIIDMPKVTQMLDAGWHVRIYKGPMGSYEARGWHPKPEIMKRAIGIAASELMPDLLKLEPAEYWLIDDEGWLMADDFTPEQALTRLAYKVHGQILVSEPRPRRR